MSPVSLFLINDSLSFSVFASCLSPQLSGTRFGLLATVILVTQDPNGQPSKLLVDPEGRPENFVELIFD